MNKINYFGVDAYLCDDTKTLGGSFYSDLTIYEPEKVKWIADKLQGYDNCVLIDVGASTGSYALLPLIVPRLMVYSFEPCNKTREVLFQNIKLNHLLFDVDFRPNVISDFEGVGRFFELTDDSQKALSMLEGNPASHKKGEWTSKKVTTIDLFTFDNKIKPTAIKIDTEGNELAVLKGATGTIKKHHPIIQCEYSQENANQYGYNVNRIAEFLMMFGYEIEIKDGDLFAV